MTVKIYHVQFCGGVTEVVLRGKYIALNSIWQKERYKKEKPKLQFKKKKKEKLINNIRKEITKNINPWNRKQNKLNWAFKKLLLICSLTISLSAI